MRLIVNINGTMVDPEAAGWPVLDGAPLYGDTLFETILARGGRLCFAAEHLDRIELSARLLAFPFDRPLAESALKSVAELLAAPASRLRLTLSRGTFPGLALPPAAGARQVVTAVPYVEPTDAERSAGVACVFAPNRRVNPLSHLPQMKRGNYADCLYAADYARRRGAREALFLSENGQVLEGASSNLFLVRGGTLFTPPAGELVLPGIMRRQVLNAADSQGIPAEEREITREELFAADEAFLTNALAGLLPIAAVEGRSLLGGDLWRRLLREVDLKERYSGGSF